MVDIQSELMTLPEAADYTGRAEVTLARHPATQGLKFSQRTRFYLKRQLDAYVNGFPYDANAPFDPEQPALGGYEAYILSQVFGFHQACEYLEIGVATLKRAKASGLIAPFKAAGDDVYLKSDLDHFLENRPKRGRPETPDSRWHGYHAKYKHPKQPS
jgi:hypothetical protein